jgi:prevent-host-death family protein
MKTMLVSEFKAKCIAVLKEVQRSGNAVVVTRRGVPMVRVEPLRENQPKKELGMLEGTMGFEADIVHADTTVDWEA